MERDGRGRFQTGNQAARGKRGFKDRGRQLARMFTDGDIEQVYSQMMAKLVEGDTATLSLICRYVAPPLKPTLNPTPFDYDTSDPLKGAESIMVAIAEGQLPADVGRTLLEGIGAVQRIKEIAELELRLKELEDKLESHQ